MNFDGCKFYKDFYTKENIGVISADGNSSCLLHDTEYLKWVAEGNTPLPAEEA